MAIMVPEFTTAAIRIIALEQDCVELPVVNVIYPPSKPGRSKSKHQRRAEKYPSFKRK